MPISLGANHVGRLSKPHCMGMRGAFIRGVKYALAAIIMKSAATNTKSALLPIIVKAPSSLMMHALVDDLYIRERDPQHRATIFDDRVGCVVCKLKGYAEPVATPEA
jgi:hypothetical protein